MTAVARVGPPGYTRRVSTRRLSSCGALVLLATAACATRRVTTTPGPEGPAQTAYAPRGGAYGPPRNFVRDRSLIAARCEVPVLILAGGQDRYHNCCVIESMRDIEAAAKARPAPFQLVVYPQADHGFNLTTSAYRGDDEA